MNGHRLRVFALKFHPYEPNIFISGGWDDTVQFWDLRQKGSTRSLFGPHICGDALDIDPVHNHILTGSWRKENTLQIWDFNNGAKIKDVPIDHMHSSLLYCAQWLGKDYMVCGGCDHNMAMVIDRGTLNVTGQVYDLPQGVYCVDSTKTGAIHKLAIGSEHQVHIVKNEKK
ncbi:WD repeat-containing protein 38 [Lingula anatina]|nr:WD repeat-containing protein 38 [Lingula anatina]|eukprot:XP_013405486.1 WD repeat-containing protein 38 [Lingula anatina]